MFSLPKSFATFCLSCSLILIAFPSQSIAETISLPLCDIALFGKCAKISIPLFDWLVRNNANSILVEDGKSYIYDSDDTLIKIINRELVEPGNGVKLIKESTTLRLRAR